MMGSSLPALERHRIRNYPVISSFYGNLKINRNNKTKIKIKIFGELILIAIYNSLKKYQKGSSYSRDTRTQRRFRHGENLIMRLIITEGDKKIQP